MDHCKLVILAGLHLGVVSTRTVALLQTLFRQITQVGFVCVTFGNIDIRQMVLSVFRVSITHLGDLHRVGEGTVWEISEG